MRLSVIMLLLFAGFFSCAEKRAETFNFADRDLEVSKISEDAQAPPSEQAPVAAVERKLIRNGSMTLEIKDIEETRHAIEKVCKEFNAWLPMNIRQSMISEFNILPRSGWWLPNLIS